MQGFVQSPLCPAVPVALLLGQHSAMRITASGDSGHSTKCFYGHGVMTLLHGIVDYFKNTGRIVHECEM